VPRSHCAGRVEGKALDRTLAILAYCDVTFFRFFIRVIKSAMFIVV
jgi:hypothetical protein